LDLFHLPKTKRSMRSVAELGSGRSLPLKKAEN
jgi:hypothetical protein